MATRLNLGTRKPDLSTIEGLVALAQSQPGGRLGKKAKQIATFSTESPTKVFSGGPIMDIFDAMNTLQYGVVGLLKGKGFFEGVRTRQSFSDQDALGDFGLPGVIAGTVIDIAVDPMTYISPVTIAKKVGLAKPIVKGVKALGKTAPGKIFGKAFIYRFGQDPVYAETAERVIRNTAVAHENIVNIIKPMADLDPNIAKLFTKQVPVGKGFQLVRKTAVELADDVAQGVIPPETVARIIPVFETIDQNSKALVELGMLPQEIYEKTVGRYVANLFDAFENPQAVVAAGKKGGIFKSLTKARKGVLPFERLMKRKDIPAAVKQMLGPITKFGYPEAITMMQQSQLLEYGKFFKQVSKVWGADEALEGLQQIPNTKAFGLLAGKWVPEPIAGDLIDVTARMAKKAGITNKLVATWKFNKVILNPATQVRNTVSNFVLNSWEGLSPARLDVYAEAAGELKNHGKLWKLAHDQGLGLDTFTSNELKDLLVSPEGLSFGKKLGNKWDGVVRTLSNIYQKEEEFGKMAQFIFQHKHKGLSPEDAYKIAERATFNYAQVTPFIRKLRESMFGFPFITFTTKVTPQVVRTALTAPARISVAGKIKNAIENLTDDETLEAERQFQPDYIKNGLFVRMPGKDKFGRSPFFDLTYIIPFGDIVTGEFFRPGDRVEGSNFVSSFLNNFPALSLLQEIGRNKDFFGNPIQKASSTEAHEKALDVARFLGKFYFPPLLEATVQASERKTREELGALSLLPGRLGRSIKFEQEAGRDRSIDVQKRTTRTIMQEASRMVGFKITPFSVTREQEKRERELRGQLEALLLEEGVLSKFTRTFVPSEKGSRKPPFVLKL